MGRARVVRHPLVEHHLATLRDRATPPELFRRALRSLAGLLAYEATRDLPLRAGRVRTPLAAAPARRVAARVGLVPILRAGLGMVEPVLDLLPEAEVWHLGFYRDERTLRPVEYYQKLPPRRPVDVALVLDPMLATGGSAVAALETLQRWGAREVRLLALIAAPEGLRRVARRFPGVAVHVCAVDRGLDGRGFILPGLGDAGDRQFRTLPA
jgi:uracil phosphoribosyltransferase